MPGCLVLSRVFLRALSLRSQLVARCLAADRLIIVEYDMLTQRPTEVLNLIYEFLGEEPYAHDFESVNYEAPKFDSQLGLDGLHRVHKKVAPRPRQTILPPELFQKYTQLAFWRDLSDSKAFRITSQSSSNQPQQYTLPQSSATKSL